MTRVNSFALILTTIIVFAAHVMSLESLIPEGTQPTLSADNKSATISLSISVPKTSVALGETPWILVTVKNLSNEDIAFPQAQVHVEAQNGEPPTTLRQRQLTHKLRLGERPILEGGFEPTIPPGASFTRKYDLSQLYDLSKPGKYGVYVEILNMFHANDKGDWLRSPTVHFEVQSATQ